MQIHQRFWTTADGWTEISTTPDHPPIVSPQLVFAFGATQALKNGARIADLRRTYPRAYILGCSTAGEIHETAVTDDTVVATAVQFEHTRVRVAQAEIPSPTASYDIGEQLARQFTPEGLVHVFVLSDGLHVNGSELVKGFVGALPDGVALTGGLSGDGDRFSETLVALDGAPAPRRIAAVGFYGDRLRVGYGSMGGWDEFGPDRIITRSEGNVLYELDGTPALDLYKKYLGPYASALPASALLFPLALRSADGPDVVRTILAVDDAQGSMTFAGDVPRGRTARLMHAYFDRLIEGATGAASLCKSGLRGNSPALAVLISCVGRKLVLKQRIEEEIEQVHDVLGPQVVLAGFYSYGEISPFTPSAKCELHNQTMTITVFSED